MTQTQQAPITRGHLAYVDVGDGEPIVLLHGGVLDHRMWSAQVDTLARDRRVIVPDLRGHGMSSTPTGPFRHCDDVAELVRHLGIDRAVLVGVSMGGSTAVDVAIEYPDMVTALVVSGAGASEPDWRDPWMLEFFATWARNAREQDPEAWMDTFLRLAHGPHRSRNDVAPRVIEQLREQAAFTLSNHVAGREPILPGPVKDARRRSHDITVPVLAVSGALDSDDHIRLARELAAAVANGSAVTVADTAHYSNMERPEQFNGVVLEFLARRSKAMMR
jgi:pimeloyl-ACP methyl ester carboxylesterase